MPDNTELLLQTADEDIEAEEFAKVVNGELSSLLAETHHLAAVLYAPGDVVMDEGDGRGKTQFPPEAMRKAFSGFLRKLNKYTHFFTWSAPFC